MDKIDISMAWSSSGSESSEFSDTTGQLKMCVGETCLTKNEDVWSRTVNDSVLVSAYPLALWLASSWWRLNYEALPTSGLVPKIDWRMSHELGAVNHGYVWPRVIIASDGEGVKVWAEQGVMQGQSVQYLYGLDVPRVIALESFQLCASVFIESVLGRLNATGHYDNELAELWCYVQQGLADPEMRARRILEAQMGFDPEECPEGILDRALLLQRMTGAGAMAELAPFIGQQHMDGQGIPLIDGLVSQSGIQAHPELPNHFEVTNGRPWQRGRQAAKKLRAAMDNMNKPFKDIDLYHLLGVTQKQVDGFSIDQQQSVAVIKSTESGQISLIPRKRHPVAKRVEYARFIASVYEVSGSQEGWMVSTDLTTAKQQYQRAFAAEFLCPIDSLLDCLAGDFSESAREEVADHFGVSEKTVEALLINNGYLGGSSVESKVPYQDASIEARVA
ncbi:hypothetical protein [uncultured Pseudomonas sp.]|uniref:ImmA/IrrE family metallo-endopeptidase n=1 Tax=uncultured Pseudomonas sp. TaxID=114707 RepID=UPI0025F2C49E|nr:hypothetical protein [uncultured Pseudomonas sp.]